MNIATKKADSDTERQTILVYQLEWGQYVTGKCEVQIIGYKETQGCTILLQETQSIFCNIYK